MDLNQDITELISQNHLLGSGSDSFKTQLQSSAHMHLLDKGQILFLAQDEADLFYIVQKGWIKLFRETLDGTQAIIDILPQQHLFGETSIFEEGHYPYSAEAIEPTSVIALPINILKDEIESNAKFSLAMLSSMARYRKQQDQEIEHRTLQNAPQRIGCFLLRLVDQTQIGPVTIQLPYDKTLVASRLGMQPETFSRALTKLKNATGITVKGSTLEIQNITDLAGYACSACSAEFPCRDLKKGSCGQK